MGDIAPLPWFGTESLTEAIAFCHSLPAVVSTEQLLSIPDALPACQFGFGMALELLQVSDRPQCPTWRCAHLLPSGHAALSESLQSDCTYKWKIGVAEEERTILRRLVEQLPDGSQVRLDANGGLDATAAADWLTDCDRYAGQCGRPVVEFLEQPLPVDQVALMQRLGDRFQTPIALDESVATLRQLVHWWEWGWSGITVIKPAIAGYPHRLRQVCQPRTDSIVWSSVFETAIAQWFIEQQLVLNLPGCDRAVGFGVNHWLQPGSDPYPIVCR
jgi:O-succinylbenzoate synthase